jgi:hypothetical protein
MQTPEIQIQIEDDRPGLNVQSSAETDRGFLGADKRRLCCFEDLASRENSYRSDHDVMASVLLRRTSPFNVRQ